jgi:cAMP-dependent protein kinase regulator
VDSSRLAGAPVFAGLPEEELGAIADAASEVQVEEGEPVATEADFGHGMYVIESGTAEVRLDGKPPRSLGQGEVFGEIAAIASGRRTASVVATSPMRLIAIFKRDLWALERSAPQATDERRAADDA